MTEPASGHVDLPDPPAPDRAVTRESTDDGDPAAGPDGAAELPAPVAGPGPAGAPAEVGPPEEGEPGEGPVWTPHEPLTPTPVSGPGSSPVMGDYQMALIAAVNVDLPNQHPTVVLRESESPRRQLSFSIGLQDAVVLTHAMRRIPTPRPLTHELMSQVLQGFDIDVVAVRLVGRQGAIYFAELDLRGRTGRSVHSCRPSDGLTIALLQPVSVPILIDRRLFEVAGDVTPPGPGSPAGS